MTESIVSEGQNVVPNYLKLKFDATHLEFPIIFLRIFGLQGGLPPHPKVIVEELRKPTHVVHDDSTPILMSSNSQWELRLFKTEPTC